MSVTSNVDFVGIYVGPVKEDRQWPTFHLHADIRSRTKIQYYDLLTLKPLHGAF